MKVLCYFVVLIFIFFFAFTFPSIIKASPMPPAPVCQIEGQILSIDRVRSTYEVVMDITSISTFEEENFDWIACDEEYKSSLEENHLDYFDTERLPLGKDMVIRGLVHTSGDEFSGGVNKLYDVKILSGNTNPTTETNKDFLSEVFESISIFFETLFYRIDSIFRGFKAY